MNFKRIGRILVCLALVCALLIHISPVKARADVVSGTLAITSAAGVTISAPMVVAAALLVLGVGYVTDSDFQRVVNDCVVGLGDFVVDGSIALVQTVDSLGKTTYYVGCDVLEAIRGWLFDSETVSVTPCFTTEYVYTVDGVVSSVSYDRAVFKGYYNTRFNSVIITYAPSSIDGVAQTKVKSTSYKSDGSTVVSYINYNSTWDAYATASNHDIGAISGLPYLGTFTSNAVDSVKAILSTLWGESILVSDAGLTLANVPTSPIDGTSARTWAPEYANRGLYVVPGSGTGGNEGQDGKWFWPLAFGLTAGVLGAMSQAEHWTAETPAEFEEYEKEEEYEVTPAPEFEGYPSIEIEPVTTPDVDPGGSGSGSGDDDSESGGGGTDYTSWFERLIKGIEELPTKFTTWFTAIVSFVQQFPTMFEEWMAAFPSLFESWLSDLKNFALDFPSLFEEWINNVIGAIQEAPAQIEQWINGLPDRFAGYFESVQLGFASVVDAVTGVGEYIVNGIRSAITDALSFLFEPEEGFIESKVQTLSDEFTFVSSIIATGKAFTTGLSGVTTSPPIIYVDLGASNGTYNYGGKTVFMDLSWYAEYKPTVDIIISAFLWICFIWRLILKLPGIINGMPGDFVMGSAHLFGLDNHLPSRNAAYEIQRAENRNSVRRGPPK